MRGINATSDSTASGRFDVGNLSLCPPSRPVAAAFRISNGAADAPRIPWKTTACLSRDSPRRGSRGETLSASLYYARRVFHETCVMGAHDRGPLMKTDARHRIKLIYALPGKLRAGAAPFCRRRTIDNDS